MCKFKLHVLTRFPNEALLSNLPSDINTNNLCCVKAIHAVNAVLWHPSEQTQNTLTNRQTDKQTNQRTDYYNSWLPTRFGIIIVHEYMYYSMHGVHVYILIAHVHVYTVRIVQFLSISAESKFNIMYT